MEGKYNSMKKPRIIKPQPKPQPKKRKSRNVKRSPWQKGFAWFFACLALLIVIGYLSMMMYGQRMLDLNSKQLKLAEASIVYDSNSKEVSRLYLENRESIDLSEMPEMLIQTFIFTEDRRFNEHSGVDVWSIGRAVIRDIRQQSWSEGGSTITQQLAKNLFLEFDKTLSRKVAELSIAFALESRYSKEEILEMYLNRIYFGRGAYGVKAASNLYFAKELNQLEPWEIAALAAIPKAPSYYNPVDDPERAKQRRHMILRLMQEHQLLDQEAYDNAVAVDYLEPERTETISFASFSDFAMQEIITKTDIDQQELFLNGYRIYTTLNTDVQAELEAAFANDEWFPPNGEERAAQGAMVILDHHQGSIIALSGGRNYVQRGLNRVNIQRQPGSAIKPLIVYAPALETGLWHPYSKLVDREMSFAEYSPQNYNHQYSGEVSMMQAIRESKNLPAVWLLDQIGIQQGLDYMDKIDIPMAAEDRNLSAALGGLTYGVTPLDMAKGFAAFANHGEKIEPYVIKRVENAQGEVVYEHEIEKEQVLSAQSSYYMTRMLEDVVQDGTGQDAQMERPVAGKTGSTQLSLDHVKDTSGYRDIWFVGYTAEWTAAVWMGFDQTDENHYIQKDSRYPARLFKEVMSRSLQDDPIQDFRKPEGVDELTPPPSTPKAFQAEYIEREKTVIITWDDEDNKGEDKGVYRIYRKSEKDPEFILLQEAYYGEVHDLTVEPDITYTYYVTYYDPTWQLESAPSPWITLTIPEQNRRSPLDAIRDWFR